MLGIGIGLDLGLLGGASNPLAPLRVVAAAQRMAQSFNTAPGGKESFVFRDICRLGGTPSSMVPAFLNWANISSVDTQNTNAVTLTAVWMERVATGQIVPVTFSGSRSFTMPASGTAVRYLADEIPASVWTGAALTRGEDFAVAGKGTVPVSGKCMAARYKNASQAASYFGFFAPGTDVTGIDYTGNIVPPTGAASSSRGFSAVLAGRFTVPGFVAAGCIGDSIADGLQEQGAQERTGQGPFEMINFRNTQAAGYLSAVIANNNLTIPTLMCALSGERYTTTISNWSLRIALLAELCNVIVDEFGTNNFQSASSGNPTDTVANVQSYSEGVWTALRAAKPAVPIIKTKLLPITTSSPVGGPTKASQTPAFDWASAGKVDQWHTLLAAAVGAGKISAFIDTRSPVKDPSDEHYWISNGTANYYVAETGTDPTPLTHPYAQTSNLIAPVIRTAVDAYAGLVT